jgi:serine phosphatase RsbU (regulator of sigma subunit)
MSSELGPQTAIACPLRSDGDFLDVLYLTLPPNYATDEWLALVSLAVEAYDQADTVWVARRHAEAHAAIERELETARRIQQGLVPREPRLPGIEVAIGFDPCKWVGGDYVDAVPMPDGRVLFAVADVCGKGLQAALVTFSLHTMVRATIDAGLGLREMMERLNRHLCGYLPDDSFATMVCVAVDPRTGTLECINAGHPPGFIVAPDGTVRTLQVSKNAALGVDVTTMTPDSDVLAAGELMLLYTDGMTELRNDQDQMLGEEQLALHVAGVYGAAPESSVASVARDLAAMVEHFRGNLVMEDDRAFLIARRQA